MPINVKIVPNIRPAETPSTHGPLVVALVYDGLATFEFGIAVEVFGLPRPEMGPSWYRFAIAAAHPGLLRARGGFTLAVDGGLELLADAATIIVPGWGDEGQAPMPQPLLDALRAAEARGARLAAICGGAFVLAAAGLLSGKTATTHWRFAETFAAAHPDVRLLPDVIYVDEGQILTSAGSAAGIDLCLHLVRRDFGAAAANRVARRLVVAPHRDGGQAQFTERPVPTLREGARLGPLLDRMRADLSAPHPIAKLAASAGMSVRTFLRRFTAMTGQSPAAWLLAERLAHARELLEGGATSLEDVAATCGFGSTATMRHHFRSKLGVSPAAYRVRFSSSPPNFSP
jgi:AraC family transcriptional activator FtrA